MNLNLDNGVPTTANQKMQTLILVWQKVPFPIMFYFIMFFCTFRIILEFNNRCLIKFYYLKYILNCKLQNYASHEKYSFTKYTFINQIRKQVSI